MGDAPKVAQPSPRATPASIDSNKTHGPRKLKFWRGCGTLSERFKSNKRQCLGQKSSHEVAPAPTLAPDASVPEISPHNQSAPNTIAGPSAEVIEITTAESTKAELDVTSKPCIVDP